MLSGTLLNPLGELLSGFFIAQNRFREELNLVLCPICAHIEPNPCPILLVALGNLQAMNTAFRAQVTSAVFHLR